MREKTLSIFQYLMQLIVLNRISVYSVGYVYRPKYQIYKILLIVSLYIVFTLIILLLFQFL